MRPLLCVNKFNLVIVNVSKLRWAGLVVHPSSLGSLLVQDCPSLHGWLSVQYGQCLSLSLKIAWLDNKLYFHPILSCNEIKGPLSS